MVRSRSRRRPPRAPRRARPRRPTRRRGSSASRRRGRTSRGPARTRHSTGDRGGASRGRRSRRTARAPARRGTGRGRDPRADRRAGRPNRASASGWRGTCDDRPEDLRGELGRVADERSEQPPPRPPVRAAQAVRRSPPRDRSRTAARPPSSGCATGASGWIDLDAARGEVDRAEERRGERQRQDRRAHVVAEPGERQLHGPGPATGLVGGLVDADRAPGTGQRDRRGQAVRPGPDDDRVDRRLAHGSRSTSERTGARRRWPSILGGSMLRGEQRMDKIGAAVWATGRAGRVIVEAGLTRPWLEFRGGIVYSPAKEGLDLGEACGLDVRLGAPVSTDVDAVLARPDIDVVFYCGHRHADRGGRRVPAGEPGRQGCHHDRRARPPGDDPGRDGGRRAGCRRRAPPASGSSAPGSGTT